MTQRERLDGIREELTEEWTNLMEQMRGMARKRCARESPEEAIAAAAILIASAIRAAANPKPCHDAINKLRAACKTITNTAATRTRSNVE